MPQGKVTLFGMFLGVVTKRYKQKPHGGFSAFVDAVNAQTGGIEVRDTTPLNREGLDAAADMFWTLGVHHGWWKETVHQSWRFYDPIGREEFLDEVARIVRAYQSRLPGLAHLTREAKSE